MEVDEGAGDLGVFFWKSSLPPLCVSDDGSGGDGDGKAMHPRSASLQ